MSEIRSLTLEIPTAQGPARIQFELDTSRYSQRIIHNHLSQGVYYEPEVSRFMKTHLRPGDAFVDVGAHVGYFSLLAARFVGPEGRVLAIEANADNVRQFRQHVAANTIANIDIVETVVGDRPSTRTFYTNVDNDGGHSLWNPGLHVLNERSRERVVAQDRRVDTLDAVLSAWDRIKMMKMDIEGSELLALQGATGLLADRPPEYIVCEMNEFAFAQMGTSQMAFRAWMAGFGYQAFTLADDGTFAAIPGDRMIERETVFNLLFWVPR